MDTHAQDEQKHKIGTNLRFENSCSYRFLNSGVRWPFWCRVHWWLIRRHKVVILPGVRCSWLCAMTFYSRFQSNISAEF